MGSFQETIEEVFEAALALPVQERTAFLRQACGDSPELRRSVEELLALDEQAGSFLRTPLLPEENDQISSEKAPGSTSSSLPTGCMLAGRFTLNRFLARGGMGEVYEAWDQDLQERVAIKIIRPDLAASAEVIERFRREVRQARAISHPNVCRVHELFCDESMPVRKTWFFSMEFLDGHTLSEHIRHFGAFAPERASELVRQIVQGLIAAHSVGAIHRDLKTGNIMLVTSGPGSLRAVITDFGLALNVLRPDAGLEERAGQGTPAFMAPEQRATGKVTVQADQYALGVIMHEMLTGSRVPRRESGRSGTKQGRSLVPGPLPAPWDKMVSRCLQVEPQDRFENLEELLVLLRNKRSSSHKGWYLMLSCIALVLLAGSFMGSRSETTSLAVLPLRNQTGDVTQNYLSAGVSEALTDDLARMPGLEVTAGSIAQRYLDKSIDPGAAGRELNVRSVVEGSITQDHGALRVPIEVIDVRTGRQVWGKVYESSSSNLAELQHQISTDVAYQLKVPLDANTAARLERQYSASGGAYDLYLKGRFHLAQRTPDALRAAVVDFEQALGADSRYAPAYAGLADCYSLMAYYGLERELPLLEDAMKASQQALELDSTLGEAYASRALARTFLNFDWKGAEEDYRRAIELNPKYLPAHTWYGLLLLSPLGRHAEAAGQMAYVRAADPDTLVTTAALATEDFLAGDFDASIHLLQPTLKSTPGFEPAVVVLASNYLAKRNDQAVVDLFNAFPASVGASPQRALLLGTAYAQSGEQAKAVIQLQSVETAVQRENLPYETAILRAALHDDAGALDMLDIAYEKRESELVFINVDSRLAPLRSEPRFQHLLGRMKLQ